MLTSTGGGARMTSAGLTGPANATLRAALLILTYAVIVGFIDNFVWKIAEEGGLWAFQSVRALFGVAIMVLAAALFGLRLRPVRPRAVLARSLVHAGAILAYFASLGVLPVPEAVAGLFTAPIFVLLIKRFVYREAIGPFRILAVILGFAGVLLVLGIGLARPFSPGLFLPVLGGALYALGNIATREWCAGESAETLLFGFTVVLGLFGLIGLIVVTLVGPEVPDGVDGFLLRGWVYPSGTFLFWTFVQALGSVAGVALALRAYQIADASRVSIFEYAVLPISAIWGWLLWGQVLSVTSVIGILLIIGAGMLIALRPGNP